MRFNRHVGQGVFGLALLCMSATGFADVSNLFRLPGIKNDQLQVYKSPTCGCCGAWVDHMDDQGFKTQVFHPENLQAIKMEQGIPPELASCHTAVFKDNYVFEGHIPARYIDEFLLNTPEGARGLVVPGMPMGSPGMEFGERFTPYQVLQLNVDGSVEVFADVKSATDQL